MTRRPRLRKYARRQLGGGNATKAVTRTRRAAASRKIGQAPGREIGPANWRVHRRRAIQAAIDAVEQAQERESA